MPYFAAHCVLTMTQKLSDFVCAFPILRDQVGDDRQN
jgi:hypothetical protein